MKIKKNRTCFLKKKSRLCTQTINVSHFPRSFFPLVLLYFALRLRVWIEMPEVSFSLDILIHEFPHTDGKYRVTE